MAVDQLLSVREDKENFPPIPPSLVGVAFMKFNRRDFLWTSASLAAVAASEAAFAQQSNQKTQTRGTGRGTPSERMNVAVIGIRGRGREHLDAVAGKHNCVVTHICDADSGTLEEGSVKTKLGQVTQRQGNVRPEFVQDLRRIM